MSELTNWDRKVERFIADDDTLTYKGGTKDDEYLDGSFVYALERY